jgi:hypothetical protein
MAGQMSVGGVAPQQRSSSLPMNNGKGLGKDAGGLFFILAIGKPILFPETSSNF